MWGTRDPILNGCLQEGHSFGWRQKIRSKLCFDFWLLNITPFDSVCLITGWALSRIASGKEFDEGEGEGMSVYARPHEHGLPGKEDADIEDDDWETDPEPAVRHPSRHLLNCILIFIVFRTWFPKRNSVGARLLCPLMLNPSVLFMPFVKMFKSNIRKPQKRNGKPST